ncbi:MAG: cytochrome P450 [Pseudomonadota bacterium]
MLSDKINITSSLMPGPAYIPWLGWRLQGLSMLKDPMQFFMNTYKRYGLLSAWDKKNPKHICAFGPELYKEIITNPDTFIVDAFREGNLPKNSPIERLSFGLMRLNGDVHLKHRKLMQPAFRQEIINQHTDVIVQTTQQELDNWKLNEIRQVDLDIMRLISFISMKTMFGLSLASEAQRLQLLLKDLVHCAASPLTLLLRFAIPGTPYHNMLKISEQIEALIRNIIKQKQNTNSVHNDVLSILVNANSEDEKGLSEDEIISEAYTVLCHESSAACLSWTIFLLDQHPGIWNQLVEENDFVLQGDYPTVAKLGQLTLLENVIKESVRLMPPAGFAMRYANQDTHLGGYFVPKDAMIFLSSYVSNRLESVYAEPLRFMPQRWDHIKPTPHEYTAFGAGTHSCMGRHFALLEIKIILSMLLQRFRPSLIPTTRVDRGMRVSLVPKNGLNMRIYKKNTQIQRPDFTGNLHQSIKLT